MRINSCLAAVIGACLALGCGGSVSSGYDASGGRTGSGGSGNPAGSGGNAGRGGAGASGGSADVTGSYNLTFKNVVSQGPAYPSPSEGATARVDIRKKGGSYEAVVTPRFGDPAKMTITVTASQVQLAGANVTIVAADGMGDTMTDTWDPIMIQRGSDGSLSGPIAAEGVENANMGDADLFYPVSSQGSVVPDKTAPEFAPLSGSVHGPANALLPWDKLSLRAAEGVDASKLGDKLHVDFASSTPPGTPPTVSWSLAPQPQDPTGWAGAVTATGTLDTWPSVSTSLTVTVDAGVPDLAGNVSKSFSTGSKLLWIGGPEPTVSYGANATDYGYWGNVTMLAPGDPACENGSGCARIGTFQNSGCGADRAGLAGVIEQPAGVLHIRYRVLVGPDYPGDTTMPSSVTTPFGVDTVAPGGVPTQTLATVDPASLSALPTPDGDLAWGTPWQTLDIPTTSDITGYAIYAGFAPGKCGPAWGPPTKAAVFISSVSAD